MNIPSSDDSGTIRPVWTAPRLVPLTAADLSDGGLVNNLTEGKVISVPGVFKGSGNGNFALGSG
jgi:hypothetical protein